MLELEAAREKILATLPPATAEDVDLAAALGRVLFDHLESPLDLPGFDNSAVDGYALRAADLTSVSPEKPVNLQVVGRIEAGHTFDGEVRTGECVRLFTGSPMPRGADSVVMQEETRASGPNEIACLEAAKPWDNVRFRGEDLKKGAVIAEPGDDLHAGRLALLAAAGFGRVKVGKRARVGLLATGSELLEPGEVPKAGKIYESNRVMLEALSNQAGAVTRRFPVVLDTPDATRLSLEAALNDCDFVVTSGGVSVGEADFVKTAFAEIGGRLDFWKIAIRPGRPFAFGRIGEKYLFALPGNPGSAFVTFLLLAWPALRKWQGASRVLPPSAPARLAETLANRSERRSFLRVFVDAEGAARPSGLQGSHSVTSLANANGLVDVPGGTVLEAGAVVNVIRWA